MDVSLSELWESVMDREAWRAAIHGVARPEQPLGRGYALSRLGAELELRRSGISRGNRDLGVAFQNLPRSQASSRG